jgi:dTMP kinase
MNAQRGFFAAIDGPSGVGKTTITCLLADQLAARGYPVAATREPTATALGTLARYGTDDYHGLTLACLVAADRYHHLEHEIRPALHAGQLVLCDRYIASSLVLQQLDGVPPGFLWQLNQHADRPDLYVILSGDTARTRGRAEQRGHYSRFHRGGILAGQAEAALYEKTATEMTGRGFTVLTHDIGTQTALEAADSLTAAIVARWRPQPEVS